jgi:amino acid transporter
MSQFYPDKGESEVNQLVRYGFILILVILMTLMNYRGLDFVGKSSTFIYIFSMSAFFVMTIIAIPKSKAKCRAFLFVLI